MTTIIIIGAGLGGLAAALRLRNHGFEVLVLEKQSRVGGRSNLIEERGFRVDIGPTILVMKSMFEETYRAIGRDFDERIKLVRLDPHYRIYYNVRNYDRITDLANPMAALRMIQTSAYRNLYGQVSRFFHTDKLRKAFSFHSMFLGLSPFESPAMYSMITYADLTGGMYYPMGGIYSIIEDMIRIAAETGVQIRTEAAVEEILIENGRAVGVRLASGEQLRADIIVSNADLPYTYRSFQAHIDWESAAPVVRERLLKRLEKIVDPEIRRHIVWERDYRPADWQHDVNAVHGTAFGSLSHHFFQSAYFRPHNKAHDIEGLYFVGQGTYPGIGTPMVLISARLLAERLTQA